MDSDPNDSQVFFAVTAANAQTFLIVTSAAIALLKSFLALGAYSYIQVALALLGLISIGLAFAIYFLFDVLTEEGFDAVAGWIEDGTFVYFLAFATAILMAAMDMCITFQSVRVYKRVKHTVGVSRECLDITKKYARNQCITILVVSLALQIVVPFVAFVRSGWDTIFFSPSEIVGIAEILVVCSLVLQLLSTALLTKQAFCTPNFRDFDGEDVGRLTTSDRAQRLRSKEGSSVYLVTLDLMGRETPMTSMWALGSISVILTYVALYYVSGMQAGAMCYLSMITFAHFVSILTGSARRNVWECAEVLATAVDQHVAKRREEESPTLMVDSPRQGELSSLFHRPDTGSSVSALTSPEQAMFLRGVPVAESRPWDARYSAPIAINTL